VYKSTDGGFSFPNDIGNTIHVDQHVLAFAPGNANTIYVGNDGGLFVSKAGAAFVSLNTGLVITQFYPGLALNGSVAMGGTQDNGTNFTTAAKDQSPSTWTQLFGGDGGFAAIEPTTPPAIAYGETQWAANSGYSGPRKSTNIGVNTFFLATTGINLGDPARFIPPLVMSPSTSSTLYFGTKVVYKTTNSAGMWNPISPDLTIGLAGQSGCASNTTNCIRTIAEAKSNGKVVYVGTGNGLVWMTPDGGTTWNLINAAPIPLRAITDIAVNPTNENNVFVTVSGFGTTPGVDDGHVFMSINNGVKWTDISGTMPSRLPNIPVNAIVLDPSAPTTEILVGTDLGVYRTHDGGTTWSPFNSGLPNVPVLDLVLNQGALAAATHGRGVWTASIGSSVTAAHDFNIDGLSDILWFHNPTGTVAIWLMNGLSTPQEGTVGAVGANSGWSVVGTGDFNGDGKWDILWYHAPTGTVAVWLMNGFTVLQKATVGVLSGWTVAGTGDFNGDGNSDILWYNVPSGTVGVWFLNGAKLLQSGTFGPVPTNWLIAETGDFNGDRKSDILWRDMNGGTVAIWLINGLQILQSNNVRTVPLEWQIQGSNAD